MKLTEISKRMMIQARNTEELDYDLLFEVFAKNAFPVYDVGAVVLRYLAAAGALPDGELLEENLEGQLKRFAKEHGFSGAYLNRIVKNEKALDRKSAIELCFCLGLDLEQANIFLVDVRQNELHLRSFDELIYAYFLKDKSAGTFKDAEKLAARYEVIYESGPSKGRQRIYGKQATEQVIEKSYTASVKEMFRASDFDLKKLCAFLDTDGKEIMSGLNATATEKVKGYMNEIWGEMEIVMQMENDIKDVVQTAWIFDGYEKVANITQIDKEILNGTSGDLIKEWNPNLLKYFKDESMATNPTVLSSIRGYKAIVSRKTFLLVLLYYLSWICYVNWSLQWEEKESLRRRFPTEKRYLFARAVAFANEELEVCGFPPLHPRVPFDFAVLSALANVDDPHEAFTKAFRRKKLKEKREEKEASKSKDSSREDRIVFVQDKFEEEGVLSYSDENGMWQVRTNRTTAEWKCFANSYVRITGVWSDDGLSVERVQNVSV